MPPGSRSLCDPPTITVDDETTFDDLTGHLDRSIGAQRRLYNELDRLVRWGESDDTGADPRDYARILDYHYRYDRGESKINTQRTHINAVRMAAVRLADASTDADALVDATAADINTYLSQCKSGAHPDVKADGIVVKPHQASLRTFYRWHADLGVAPDEIDLDDDYSGRDLGPEDIWTADHVDRWLEASRGEGDMGYRNRALFAVALATGQRIDAVRTLRVGDVVSEGPTMDIALNEDDGQLKGANGTRAALWAKHYLRPWLENHPFKADDDAALFPVVRETGTNNPNREGGPKSPLKESTVRQMFRRVAETAGVDDERPTYFHILRHSAITRMVVENLKEQQIKRIAGWDPDSSQFSTYVHIADELMNDSVREGLGVPTSGTDHPVIGRPTLNRCPECKDYLPGGETDTCPTCFEPLTYAAEERAGERVGATAAAAAAGEAEDLRAELAEVRTERDELAGRLARVEAEREEERDEKAAMKQQIEAIQAALADAGIPTEETPASASEPTEAGVVATAKPGSGAADVDTDTDDTDDTDDARE